VVGGKFRLVVGAKVGELVCTGSGATGISVRWDEGRLESGLEKMRKEGKKAYAKKGRERESISRLLVNSLEGRRTRSDFVLPALFPYSILFYLF
jgi:hypothetical protein